MTAFLVYVATAAVLFAAGMCGIRWLHENATWWHRQRDAQIAIQGRMLPAIRSHPEGRGAPRAISAAPRVVPGTVLPSQSSRRPRGNGNNKAVI